MATQFNVSTRKGITFETTDATATTAVTFTPRPSKVYWVEVKAVAANTADFSEGATYWRQAGFRVTAAGTVTQLGSTRSVVTDNETTAGWDFTIDVSANVIRARVTGAAATTIRWQLVPTILEVDAIEQV